MIDAAMFYEPPPSFTKIIESLKKLEKKSTIAEIDVLIHAASSVGQVQ